MSKNVMGQAAAYYQKQIKELATAHEAQMQKMQESLEALSREMDMKIQQALVTEGSQGLEPDAPENPTGDGKESENVDIKNLNASAAWIKAEDGEHLLVLNQAAAATQVALLDQLSLVLTDLQKLAQSNRQ